MDSRKDGLNSGDNLAASLLIIPWARSIIDMIAAFFEQAKHFATSLWRYWKLPRKEAIFCKGTLDAAQ
jgi:hypothetical protein